MGSYPVRCYTQVVVVYTLLYSYSFLDFSYDPCCCSVSWNNETGLESVLRISSPASVLRKGYKTKTVPTTKSDSGSVGNEV